MLASVLAVGVLGQDRDNSQEREALSDQLATVLDDLFLDFQTNKLTRGDVFGLFAVLGKLIGIPEPAISGPYLGTRRVLRDEFSFEGFTPRGSGAFRHRKTNRVLCIAIEGGQLLIGMYEPSIDSLAAFVKPNEAFEWVRGGKVGKRITNPVWFLP
jgi:hypothetical protein